ncbi:MAG: class II fumarate hydratase [Thermoguttaceae bacterium]|nr:class II fumarate hydratase [Thermoguttaceae bacterium]MDW8036803.1 class II fumarate hydratase [Thermoguttaceae bacterium]
MGEFRIERDTMGPVQVPAEVYWGAQTQRAVENFPISGRALPGELIHALGLVKWAAAVVNRDLGRFQAAARPLSDSQVEALITACWEVAEGKWDHQFPVDVYQTGSGTSSNMNANEVIAHRAMELAGLDRLAPQKTIHPNDHVNLGQSSNDVFPTAIRVAAATAIKNQLLPALRDCHQQLSAKAAQWQEIIKIARTHLADATPIRLGQEVSGWARQMELAGQRATQALQALCELPIGGTAVGTGINTHPNFGRRVAELLAQKTGIPFVEAANHFEAQSQQDALVDCHGQLRTIAVSLFNVANNIRFLASGPRCGLYEIILPELQPGSSIMPGKVNPVLCEALMQAAARVIGNDQLIAFCGATGGQFQLHVLMPVMAEALLESIRLLARSAHVFAHKYLAQMEANPQQCQAMVEKSLALVTALVPYLGYDRAAQLAKEAFQTGKTIRQLCQEQCLLSKEELDQVLDPRRMCSPG